MAAHLDLAVVDRRSECATRNALTDGTIEAVRRLRPDVALLTPGRNPGVRHARTPEVAFSDDKA
ncbi:hypothetical protein [Streptomyces xantholiticus]|uniref:Uncharacterized protein n=1 Tax=Streptomyces xantholiticus TaxID=68285 RepID=A0ABV1UMS8_9ACTN